MQRKITEYLKYWKDKADRKPLLLTGVRQCGKTFTLKEFGEGNFRTCLYFNFEREEKLGEIFEYDFNTERILNEIALFKNLKSIDRNDTLLIFDEIQACPRAITSLKYFCEDMRELPVIAAGSLLGVALKQEDISFPVGKVDRKQMYPMSFEEFVIATGNERLLRGVSTRKIDDPLPDLYKVPLEKLLKQYFVIGGMPEAVQKWIDTSDIHAVDEIQTAILQSYRDDFPKHAPLEMVPRLNALWDSIAVQLARENNKFMFSTIKHGARAKDYEDALQWLVDAGLIIKPERVEFPSVPLSVCADPGYFKVYFSDVGLLRNKARVYYMNLLDDFDEYTHFKGSLAENYVFSELVKMNLPTYFYRSKYTAEVDVLSEYHGHIIPAEVKSAENTTAKSYSQFLKEYSPLIGFKISLKNIGINEFGKTTSVSLPLYITYRMQEYIEAVEKKK